MTANNHPLKNPAYCVKVFDRNNPDVVIEIDWYDYIEGLRRKGITLSSPVEHASKKMFAPGNRGHKDLAKDLREIIWGLETGLRLLAIEVDKGEVVLPKDLIHKAPATITPKSEYKETPTGSFVCTQCSKVVTLADACYYNGNKFCSAKCIENFTGQDITLLARYKKAPEADQCHKCGVKGLDPYTSVPTRDGLLCDACRVAAGFKPKRNCFKCRFEGDTSQVRNQEVPGPASKCEKCLTVVNPPKKDFKPAKDFDRCRFCGNSSLKKGGVYGPEGFMCRACLNAGKLAKELVDKTKPPFVQCCSCGTMVDKKDAVKAGAWWCMTCYNQSLTDEAIKGTVLCSDCDHRVDEKDAVRHNNKWWCKTCYIMEVEK